MLQQTLLTSKLGGLGTIKKTAILISHWEKSATKTNNFNISLLYELQYKSSKPGFVKISEFIHWAVKYDFKLYSWRKGVTLQQKRHRVLKFLSIIK